MGIDRYPKPFVATFPRVQSLVPLIEHAALSQRRLNTDQTADANYGDRVVDVDAIGAGVWRRRPSPSGNDGLVLSTTAV
ncbi:hypothetical protein EVAR_49019_1 [Eumeta japonica]|uniref:Uncharacterized protein n=1 Tax=Eumeta variegata TaxID=151549 RepID=A0A4C1XSQ5_EUMVA|nr:hypothetical protein EVAR_49019_1 [Eumeta japonica]